MSKESIAKAAAFVLWMGAANAVATEEQRVEMRARIEPPLQEYVETGDEGPTRAVVNSILGPWEPDGLWAAYIAALDS